MPKKRTLTPSEKELRETALRLAVEWSSHQQFTTYPAAGSSTWGSSGSQTRGVNQETLLKAANEFHKFMTEA